MLGFHDRHVPGASVTGGAFAALTTRTSALAGSAGLPAAFLGRCRLEAETETAVATVARRACSRVAKISKYEGTTATSGVRVALHCIQLGKLALPSAFQTFPVHRERGESSRWSHESRAPTAPLEHQELSLLQPFKQRHGTVRSSESGRHSVQVHQRSIVQCLAGETPECPQESQFESAAVGELALYARGLREEPHEHTASRLALDAERPGTHQNPNCGFHFAWARLPRQQARNLGG